MSGGPAARDASAQGPAQPGAAPQPGVAGQPGSASAEPPAPDSVPQGPAGQKPIRLFAGAYPIATPLLLDGDATWTPRFLFKGHTKGLYNWSGHVSVLAKDTIPHPPHRHPYEEVLLLLTGTVDIVVPEAPDAGRDGRISLRPGQFAYYPRDFAHTLETTSADPANYLMFTWTNPKVATRGDSLGFGVFDTGGAAGPAGGDTSAGDEGAGAGASTGAAAPAVSGGLSTRLVCESPTAFLRCLHCHVSTLSPGGGYEPHADPYDVAIVILQGEVETLGQTMRPHGVIVYPAGTRHGIHNPRDTAA